MFCYYCQKQVSMAEHARVQDAIEVILYDLNEDTFDNMFVHMIGCTPANMDSKGRVAICYMDFVRELVDSAMEVHGRDYYERE